MAKLVITGDAKQLKKIVKETRLRTAKYGLNIELTSDKKVAAKKEATKSSIPGGGIKKPTEKKTKK